MLLILGPGKPPGTKRGWKLFRDASQSSTVEKKVEFHHNIIDFRSLETHAFSGPKFKIARSLVLRFCPYRGAPLEPVLFARYRGRGSGSLRRDWAHATSSLPAACMSTMSPPILHVGDNLFHLKHPIFLRQTSLLLSSCSARSFEVEVESDETTSSSSSL